MAVCTQSTTSQRSQAPQRITSPQRKLGEQTEHQGAKPLTITCYWGRLIFGVVFLLCWVAAGRGAITKSDTITVGDMPTSAGSANKSSKGPDPTVVAHEILQIQEQLGGSVVSDFGLPEQKVSEQAPLHGHHEALSRDPVLALRQSAWQLEQSAQLLESLDLYQQADAVRATANQLRLDARGLKTLQK